MGGFLYCQFCCLLFRFDFLANLCHRFGKRERERERERGGGRERESTFSAIVYLLLLKEFPLPLGVMASLFYPIGALHVPSL